MSDATKRIKEIQVQTLGELVDRCTPAAPDPESGRRRNYAVFRGELASGPGLLSSLDLLGGDSPPHSKAHLEEHIFRNFIRHARRHLRSAPANDWELLMSAQHHGVPTRLLDWTYSPLIAAHFATLASAPKCDRVVWKLDWRTMHEQFGLKPLAFLVTDLNEALAAIGVRSPSDLFNFNAENTSPFVAMVEPPRLDARLQAQAAAFTLASVKNQSLDQILAHRNLSHCLTRLVIPSDRVEFLRDQLDLCTIDERRLFPDLDGLAAEIKRYYSARLEEPND